MIIPSWIVAILGAVSVILLWQTRAMPWRLRLTLIVPRLYFVAIYTLPIEDKIQYVRSGFIIMFIAEIIVSAISIWHRKKSIWTLTS
jgi:hypothetical protein